VQGFQTIPVANLQLALYTLTVRAPGGFGAPVPGLSFTFPISPQNVRKEAQAATAIFDTAGYAYQNGVNRSADEYGIAPPVYTLRGTTGWKLHSQDGYQWTGRESCLQLQSILQQYAQLNTAQQQNQQPDLYTLELYDYFMEEFWQVVPVGAIGIEQSADRPLMSFYTFRLAAVASVSDPVPPNLDAVAAILAASAPAGIGGFLPVVNTLLGAYS